VKHAKKEILSLQIQALIWPPRTRVFPFRALPVKIHIGVGSCEVRPPRHYFKPLAEPRITYMSRRNRLLSR
jgi:hypothetical protein